MYQLLTFGDVHFKGAVGYWLPSKAHMDGVWPFLYRFVGASEDVITLVFQKNFHSVVFILRVNDNHTDISSSSTWKWILSSPSYRKSFFQNKSVCPAHLQCRCQNTLAYGPHCPLAPDPDLEPELFWDHPEPFPHSPWRGSYQCPAQRRVLSPVIFKNK